MATTQRSALLRQLTSTTRRSFPTREESSCRRERENLAEGKRWEVMMTCCNRKITAEEITSSILSLARAVKGKNELFQKGSWRAPVGEGVKGKEAGE
jgi:hypothetical protein